MGLFGSLVRLSARLFLFVARWVVLPLILWSMPRMILLMIVSTLALLRGVPATVDLIVEKWAQEAGRLSIDSRHDRVTRRFFRIAAYITLILGWLIMSSATVAVVYLIAFFL